MLAFERSERIRKQLMDVDSQAAARHKDGKHDEALVLMERAHTLRKKFYGIGSPELERATYDLVTDLNRVAIIWGENAREAAIAKQKESLDKVLWNSLLNHFFFFLFFFFFFLRFRGRHTH